MSTDSADTSWLGRMKERLDNAFNESVAYLTARQSLVEKMRESSFVACHVLFECPPADIESLTKIGCFPFAEATTEYSVAEQLATCGSYKSSVSHLRSFLELQILGILILAPQYSLDDARRWSKGHAHTPQWRAIMRRLFDEPNFKEADKAFGFQSSLNSAYWALSDVAHTKGFPASTMQLSGINGPAFKEASLLKFLESARNLIGEVCTAFALRSPILLRPLPLSEKFGLNPPASGFLESGLCDLFRKFIPSSRLPILDKIADSDGGVRSVVDWMNSLPDLTDADMEAQLKAQDEWMQSHTTNGAGGDQS